MKAAYIKLAKGIDEGYRIANQSKLDPIKSGPYPVKRRVGRLAFELDLPPHLKMHPVITIAHLEPAPDTPDPYKRAKPPPAPIVHDGQEKYIVDRIIRKELRKSPGVKDKQWHYKIRWKGYSAKDDTWVREEQLKEDVPEIVKNFEQSLQDKAARKTRRQRS